MKRLTVAEASRKRVANAQLDDRIARAKAASPPRDPTGQHHEDVATIARAVGRDVVEMLDEWDERAAIKEYEGGIARADAEEQAVVDMQATYGVLL